MKAVYFEKHGGLEVLQYGELPTPKPGVGEVLVRVEACALNHLDLWVRMGLGIPIPMPHVLGSEIAGTIEVLGAGVSGWKRGDRVLVAPGVSCGACSACRSGHDSRCPSFQIIGFQRNGGYATHAVVPSANLIAISDALSYEEWAATPLVFLTAWHMLMTRAALKPGETVLVHAAGSGVGSAAIQVAKLAGARVFATASTKAKLALAKRLGADETIDYTEGDFAQAARDLTGGRGVDVVLEHIGQQTWTGSLTALVRGGRLVTCGATSGPKVGIDLRHFFTRELSVVGCYMGGRAELDRVLELVGQGWLKPVVDTVIPLKEAARAQARMEGRRQFGKIVLKP